MFSNSDSNERVIATMNYLYDRIHLLNDYRHKSIDIGIGVHDYSPLELYVSVRSDSKNARIELYNYEVNPDGTPDYTTTVMCAGLAAYDAPDLCPNTVMSIYRADDYYQMVSQPSSEMKHIGQVHSNNINFGPFNEENWFQLSTTNDILSFEAAQHLYKLAGGTEWNSLCFWYSGEPYMYLDEFNNFFDSKVKEWQK